MRHQAFCVNPPCPDMVTSAGWLLWAAAAAPHIQAGTSLAPAFPLDSTSCQHALSFLCGAPPAQAWSRLLAGFYGLLVQPPIFKLALAWHQLSPGQHILPACIKLSVWSPLAQTWSHLLAGCYGLLLQPPIFKLTLAWHQHSPGQHILPACIKLSMWSPPCPDIVTSAGWLLWAAAAAPHI